MCVPKTDEERLPLDEQIAIAEAQRTKVEDPPRKTSDDVIDRDL